MTSQTKQHSEVPFGHQDRLFIGGNWIKPSSDSKFDVIAPATEEIYVSVAEAFEPDVDRAVAAAREAFDRGPWPRMSHAERAGYLRALAKGLNDRAEDVALTWPNEMGILHSTAQMFSGAMGGIFEYYAGLADTFQFEERHHPYGGGQVGLLVREPVGVVAAIIPWNAPINLLSNKLAPALLAGCTVIVKASPEAPSSAYIVAEIAQAIGIPPGVINVITAERAASEMLVRHPGVDKVAFTGSTAAGRKIAAICGDRIARYTLELGGKSAAVILDDFDLETAATSLAGSTCLMSGQVCSSLTRIIVSRHRHDALVDALSAKFGAIKVGDPFDPATEIGPIAMRRQRDRIEQLIAKGESEGATLAVGGRRPAHLNRGFYIEPTVFGNVHNDSTLAREELFGPVVSVIPADNEEQAIDIANDTIYGLNNSVFTNDVQRAYEVARSLRSGTVGHNAFRTDFSIAFGGFKQSGIGREGGVEGLHPYLETKTVVLEGTPDHLAD
ncbi:aldehyde dehydrogenase family protein [Sphingomonas histidinilytica]|uniref:Betaine-aldehyde dehydrogenase n=1 Tax=Rhizorhabdus histidinilytica TaxID=439228 RepID=A0A1T5GUT0_9SPHN|nr:aldehyde dehydrogenase [Rhizorhabdus histidinilytica]MBO9380677.1 aldehyde dehydrogenase family protein [Rhizorhabdus histidinilytica]SKC12157.1 betaine-aldehyde dehydrogenase [Rhizorhabdus histidinilytica]